MHGRILEGWGEEKGREREKERKKRRNWNCILAELIGVLFWNLEEMNVIEQLQWSRAEKNDIKRIF